MIASHGSISGQSGPPALLLPLKAFVRMFTIKTLQQRLIIFLILPVAAFLTAIGAGGYFYIRGSLYQEWQEAAILRLERAAHYMDMRLSEPLQWIQSLANTGGDRQGTDNQNWILQKLREQPGVSQVSLEWQEAPSGSAGIIQEGRGGGGLAPRVANVSPPQFFYPADHQTVGLTFTLLDGAGHPLGRLEVLMKLDYLMEGVRAAGWLHTYMACLVNDDGTFLAHSSAAMASPPLSGRYPKSPGIGHAQGDEGRSLTAPWWAIRR